MCGYIYLLWSQYWQYVERQQEHMAGLISNARSGGGGVSQTVYYNHDTFSSTTDPDAIVISSGNKRDAISKRHSNDKPSNRTYVGRKYVIMVIQNAPEELKVNNAIKSLRAHVLHCSFKFYAVSGKLSSPS
jgi:hypothetical protein